MAISRVPDTDNSQGGAYAPKAKLFQTSKATSRTEPSERDVSRAWLAAIEAGWLEPSLSDLSQRLNYSLLVVGLNQKQLANKSKVSPSTINNYLKRQRQRLPTTDLKDVVPLRKICVALGGGFELPWLIAGSEQQEAWSTPAARIKWTLSVAYGSASAVEKAKAISLPEMDSTGQEIPIRSAEALRTAAKSLVNAVGNWISAEWIITGIAGAPPDIRAWSDPMKTDEDMTQWRKQRELPCSLSMSVPMIEALLNLVVAHQPEMTDAMYQAILTSLLVPLALRGVWSPLRTLEELSDDNLRDRRLDILDALAAKKQNLADRKNGTVPSMLPPLRLPDEAQLDKGTVKNEISHTKRGIRKVRK